MKASIRSVAVFVGIAALTVDYRVYAESELKDQKDRVSYGLGYQLG
jgi:hypothetical protein